MNIYIDGDACPVKAVVIEEALEKNVKVVIVTSVSHFSQKEVPENVTFIYVDDGRDAADFRIMQYLQKEDILVTQDYGLASLALGKAAIVLHHQGFQYKEETMDQLLQSRYVSAMARKSGQRTKGPKPYTEADRQKFRMLLLTFL